MNQFSNNGKDGQTESRQTWNLEREDEQLNTGAAWHSLFYYFLLIRYKRSIITGLNPQRETNPVQFEISFSSAVPPPDLFSMRNCT